MLFLYHDLHFLTGRFTIMKKFLTTITILLLSGLLCFPTHAKQSTATDKKTSKERTITISAAGDCTLGIDSRIHHTFDSYYTKNGNAYFLKKVKPVFSKDDITIVNFEGTLTTSTNRANKAFTFKGPKKYVGILKKGSVEVVTLANNHSMDFGRKGLADTQKTLKKNKIAYCYNSTIAYKKVKGIKIAFIGFSQLEGTTASQVTKAIKKAKKKRAKIIITSFHWGIEREYYPNSKQKSLAHSAINAGASLVLGHHPHVLQGIERYKGRYIVYSLGNFCFGGNTNPKDKDTMIFQQTFHIKDGKVLSKKDARVIACSLSGSSACNDYQPRILKDSSKKRVIKKLNTLSKGLHVRINSKGKLQ